MNTQIDYASLDSIKEIAYKGTIEVKADRVCFVLHGQLEWPHTGSNQMTAYKNPRVYIPKGEIDFVLSNFEDGGECTANALRRVVQLSI